MSTSAAIYVLGGPNGAGKSSVASVLIPDSLSMHQFVNADLIAQGLSPFAPASTAIAAGRIMIRRMRALRQRGESFALESTLASQNLARFLRGAMSEGYLVHVVFLWLSSVQLAQARVRGRVAAGGHDVLPDVIERRYWRGLHNFFALYQPIAQEWTLCDNSGEELVVVAEGSSSSDPTIFDSERFSRIQEQASHGS